MGEACSEDGRDKKYIQNFWSVNGKNHLEEMEQRWKDNIGLNLREVVWEVMD